MTYTYAIASQADAASVQLVDVQWLLRTTIGGIERPPQDFPAGEAYAAIVVGFVALLERAGGRPVELTVDRDDRELARARIMMDDRDRYEIALEFGDSDIERQQRLSRTRALGRVLRWLESRKLIDSLPAELVIETSEPPPRVDTDPACKWLIEGDGRHVQLCGTRLHWRVLVKGKDVGREFHQIEQAATAMIHRGQLAGANLLVISGEGARAELERVGSQYDLEFSRDGGPLRRKREPTLVDAIGTLWKWWRE